MSKHEHDWAGYTHDRTGESWSRCKSCGESTRLLWRMRYGRSRGLAEQPGVSAPEDETPGQ